MEDLRELVQKLEQAEGEKAQIEILQEIGKKLINCYTIQIGKHEIVPMLVEAYYHSAGKFEDKSIHAVQSDSEAPTYKLARERQKDHFGELYVHYGCKDGIDIVLSNGDYYLSFLIKNALVDGDFKTQIAISEYICSKCDKCDECDKGLECKYYGKKDLLQVESDNGKDVVFLVRKGVGGDFADKKLAMCPLQDVLENDDFTLEDGYKKQWKSSVRALSEVSDEEKAREKAKEYYVSGSIEDKYWKLAKESLGIE